MHNNKQNQAPNDPVPSWTQNDLGQVEDLERTRRATGAEVQTTAQGITPPLGLGFGIFLHLGNIALVCISFINVYCVFFSLVFVVGWEASAISGYPCLHCYAQPFMVMYRQITRSMPSQGMCWALAAFLRRSKLVLRGSTSSQNVQLGEDLDQMFRHYFDRAEQALKGS